MNALTTDLARSPESAGIARQLVHAQTSALGFERRADAVLMVSELVTNALLHGIGTILLRIDLEPDGVRIEVSDEGNVVLSPSPTPGAHGGWGLRIVEELADDWGVLKGSTRVWFRLDRPPAELESARA